MAVSNQTLLDNARQALNNLLLMDGVEEYSTQELRFRANRLTELETLISRLETRINLASGVRLIKPVPDVA